ncbi:hypothetical protein [Flagellimonas sp. 2504JD4-2]
MKFQNSTCTLSFLFLVICTGFPCAYAQDCNKINNWLEKAESYAEGTDINNLAAFAVMKFTSPAFHNDHFKPVFGKNYADLSNTDKEKIKTDVLHCANGKPYVANGFVTAFENGNMAYSWERQVKAINNSSVAENDRISQYEIQNRSRNRAQQQRVTQQREAYNRQRATRSRRGAVATTQNPNAYNASPKDRVNTEADYKREAAEMRTILNTIKGNAAPSQEFISYTNGALMKKVYDGDFEGFPVGLNDLQEPNLMSGFSKINEMKKYQRYLMIYLEYFSDHCASKNTAKYKEVSIQYEVVETQHNVDSSKGFTKPEIYYMKPYFEEDFRRMHKALANATAMEAIWILASGSETGLNFEPDLKTLFGKHECESPMLRQFETNLYLASKGKSSLQKLLPFLE